MSASIIEKEEDKCLSQVICINYIVLKYTQAHVHSRENGELRIAQSLLTDPAVYRLHKRLYDGVMKFAIY